MAVGRTGGGRASGGGGGEDRRARAIANLHRGLVEVWESGSSNMNLQHKTESLERFVMKCESG